MDPVGSSPNKSQEQGLPPKEAINQARNFSHYVQLRRYKADKTEHKSLAFNELETLVNNPSVKGDFLSKVAKLHNEAKIDDEVISRFEELNSLSDSSDRPESPSYSSELAESLSDSPVHDVAGDHLFPPKDISSKREQIIKSAIDRYCKRDDQVIYIKKDKEGQVDLRCEHKNLVKDKKSSAEATYIFGLTNVVTELNSLDLSEGEKESLEALMTVSDQGEVTYSDSKTSTNFVDINDNCRIASSTPAQERDSALVAFAELKKGGVQPHLFIDSGELICINTAPQNKGDPNEVLDHLSETPLTEGDLNMLHDLEGVNEAVTTYRSLSMQNKHPILFLNHQGKLDCKKREKLTEREKKQLESDQKGRGGPLNLFGHGSKTRESDFSQRKVMKEIQKLSPFEQKLLAPHIQNHQESHTNPVDKIKATTTGLHHIEAERVSTSDFSDLPSPPTGVTAATYDHANLKNICDLVTVNRQGAIFHMDGTGHSKETVPQYEHPLLLQYASDFSAAAEKMSSDATIEDWKNLEEKMHGQFNRKMNQLVPMYEAYGEKYQENKNNMQKDLICEDKIDSAFNNKKLHLDFSDTREKFNDNKEKIKEKLKEEGVTQKNFIRFLGDVDRNKLNNRMVKLTTSITKEKEGSEDLLTLNLEKGLYENIVTENFEGFLDTLAELHTYRLAPPILQDITKLENERNEIKEASKKTESDEFKEKRSDFLKSVSKVGELAGCMQRTKASERLKILILMHNHFHPNNKLEEPKEINSEEGKRVVQELLKAFNDKRVKDSKQPFTPYSTSTESVISDLRELLDQEYGDEDLPENLLQNLDKELEISLINAKVQNDLINCNEKREKFRGSLVADLKNNIVPTRLMPDSKAGSAFSLVQPVYASDGNHVLSRNVADVCNMILVPSDPKKGIVLDENGRIDKKSVKVIYNYELKGQLGGLSERDLGVQKTQHVPDGAIVFSYSDGIGEFMTEGEILDVFCDNFGKDPKDMSDTFRDFIREGGQAKGDEQRLQGSKDPSGRAIDCKQFDGTDAQKYDDISFAWTYVRPEKADQQLFTRRKAPLELTLNNTIDDQVDHTKIKKALTSDVITFRGTEITFLYPDGKSKTGKDLWNGEKNDKKINETAEELLDNAKKHLPKVEGEKDQDRSVRAERLVFQTTQNLMNSISNLLREVGTITTEHDKGWAAKMDLEKGTVEGTIKPKSLFIYHGQKQIELKDTTIFATPDPNNPSSVSFKISSTDKAFLAALKDAGVQFDNQQS